MQAIRDAVAHYVQVIEALTAAQGERVVVDPDTVLDRRDVIALEPAGRTISPNGTCRLLPTLDGWIAVNLPRQSDLDLVPAWLGETASDGAGIEGLVAQQDSGTLVAQAALLGLAVSAVGEIRHGALEPRRIGFGPAAGRLGPIRVVDLSSLWAGPLCGSILAAMGAEVTKVESRHRPDTSRASPAFDERVNGLKAALSLDFGDARDRSELLDRMTQADVIITSARPRAFAQLGLAPDTVFKAKSGLVWIAITGHGWDGVVGERVAFGDDAAAAGGLLTWSSQGEPRFAGDALADPLTGLVAACAGLRARQAGGGVMIDAAMSRVAAGVAALAQCPGPVQA